MPQITTVQNLNTAFTISNTGGTINLPINYPINYYTLDGTGITLATDLNIVPDPSLVPKQGITFELRYNGNGLISDIGGGKEVNLFGVSLSDAQALSKVIAISTYDGSAWITDILTDLSLGSEQIDTTNLIDKSVTTVKIDDLAVTGNQIANNTIDASKIVLNTITASQIAAGTITGTEIAAGTITGTEIAASTITGTEIAASTILPSNLADSFKWTSITIPVSFEAGENGADNMVRFENPIEVGDYHYSVVTSIESSDNANITIDLDGSTVSFSIGGGSAQNTSAEAAISLTSGSTPSYLKATGTKTTDGGKVLLTITYKTI